MDDKEEAECFALAANQCHEPWADEYGNHRCRAIDRARKAENILHTLLRRVARESCPRPMPASGMLPTIDVTSLEKFLRHHIDLLAKIGGPTSEQIIEVISFDDGYPQNTPATGGK